jgi:DNA-binding NarL/FixJ family response regulator
LRVCLIEDAQVIRDRLVDLLTTNGAQIAGQTDSVSEAIGLILRERPDAVVLDMKLADGNGLDVLRAVHSKAPEITVIVLTNYADEYYRELCMRAGARYFFDKTSEFGRIPDVLRELSLHKQNGNQPVPP